MAYETVQHNCAVPAETEHFKSHVTVYQKAERLVLLSLNGLNLTQSSVFTLGTAFIVGVSAYKISIDKQTVGGFVSLITYFAQLQAPLNFFGTFYTMLQNNLIDAERMLDLVSSNILLRRVTVTRMLTRISSRKPRASSRSPMRSV